MAKLVNIAGDGLPYYLWTKLAAEDGKLSAWEIGRQRAQRENGAFSYRNTVICEHDGEIAAALIGYALPDEPEPVDYADMPAIVVPLQQLEDLAPGTWYINVLAAFEQYRGRGIGSDLLKLAEHRSSESGCTGLSLIVSDANAEARRLYTRSGYAEEASRPMVKEAWQNPGENWILMRKAF